MRRLLAAACLTAVGLPGLSASATTQVLAQTFTAAPDGNGVLSNIHAPILTNNGQAAFFSFLSGTNDAPFDTSGIFLADVGLLTQVAREDARGPLADSGLAGPSLSAFNDAGQVAYTAFHQPQIVGSPSLHTIYRYTGGSSLTIAREGSAVPGGNGQFDQFSIPVISDTGGISFAAVLTGTSGGINDNSAVYRRSGGSLTEIAREGQGVPGGNGVYNAFYGNTAINASGHVLFGGDLRNTSGGTTDDNGYFLYNGSTIQTIVREGDPAPDGNGVHGLLNLTVLNNAGQAVSRADYTGTSGGSADNTGIVLYTGGSHVQVAREGQTTPDGLGQFSAFGVPLINNTGRVLFQTADTVRPGGGVYSDSGGALTTYMLSGQAVPQGDGFHGDFESFDLRGFNDAGQALVYANLTNTFGGSTDNRGIYLANGIDILPIARKGETLAGSTITSLTLTAANFTGGDNATGLNDQGQVAYRAKLSNGRDVVARFTIPDFHWTQPGSGVWHDHTNWTQPGLPTSFHDIFIQPAVSAIVTKIGPNSSVKSLTLGGGTGPATLRMTGSSSGDIRSLEHSTIAANGVLELNNNRVFAAPTLANAGIIRGEGTVEADLTNTGNVFVLTGIFNFSGDVTNTGGIDLSAGTLTFFNGLLEGNGTSGTGGAFLNGQTRPGIGSATSVMGFGGSVTLGSQHTLSVDLNGLILGANADHLATAGSVQLNGKLDLTTGFNPSFGQSYLVLSAGGPVSGSFSQIDGITISQGKGWAVLVEPNAVRLRASRIGDIDFDNDVDDADFGLAFAGFTGPVGAAGGSQWITGDLDGDGDTDDADFGIAFANFTGPGAPANVPEPASLALLALGGAIATRRRRS